MRNRFLSPGTESVVGQAKFALAYLGLVVLPLATLTAVFGRSGSVRAPVAARGHWQLYTSSRERPSPACAGWSARVRASTLTILQSGSSLTLQLEGASTLTGSGTIAGRRVRASFAPPAALRLGAQTDPATVPRSLAGTLSAAGCNALAFTALRRDTLTKAGS